MKNFLIKGRSSILCGLVIVASCSQSKEMPQSLSGECNEIRFGSNGVRVESKSFVETTNSLLQANGFKAAVVVDSDSSVMFNTSVAYDSKDAVYRVPDEHYYYPSKGTVSIYGVYPSSELISVGSGKATVTYAQNSDEDLVGAKAIAVAPQSAPVLMEFEHLLSQVTMTVKTDNPNIVCKLYGITLTDADGGVYSFADDSWVLNETTEDYLFFNSSTGESVNTTVSEVGEAMSFMPGKVDLNVRWKCFNKVSEDIVSDNNQTVSVDLEKGIHSTLNLTLPYNSSEITLVTTVEPWVEDSQDVEVKPAGKEFVFTVNEAGKKVKFAPGNLYWDGTQFKFEEHQYDYPDYASSKHVGHFYWSWDAELAIYGAEYGPEISKDDVFFAADGGAIKGWTVLSKDEWDYIIKHSLYWEPIEGIKRYGNNEGFICDGTYQQAKELFEKDNDLKDFYEGNYQSRDFDELLESESITVFDLRSRKVAGKECCIFVPDGVECTIADSYTASEWEAAEKDYGLVAIPYAGYCEEGYVYIIYGEDLFNYWTATPHTENKGKIWFVHGSIDYIDFSYQGWHSGLAIRLVKVVE